MTPSVDSNARSAIPTIPSGIISYLVAGDESMSVNLTVEHLMIHQTDALRVLTKLRGILIAVSTGNPGGHSSLQYPDLHSDLTDSLAMLGLDNPIPYETLQEWHGKWSSGDLLTYNSRREHVRSLVDPLIESIQRAPVPYRREAVSDLTGWRSVDRVLDKIRNRLMVGREQEDFQNVGLLCREALISVAQTVFDSERHPSLKDTRLSSTDAKGMLEAFISEEFPGNANKEARKYIRAAIDLANKLQHNRNATFRDAALCSQATTSVVNFAAILSRKIVQQAT